MRFGDLEASRDRVPADLKATWARHADTCQPNPFGIRHPQEVRCPCGDAVALICEACGTPVWVVVNPSRETPCEHAIQLYENGAQ